VSDGTTTLDYLKEEFCDPANKDDVQPIFKDHKVAGAGYPGVFEVMINDSDYAYIYKK